MVYVFRDCLTPFIYPRRPPFTTPNRDLATTDGTPPPSEPMANQRPALGGRTVQRALSVDRFSAFPAHGKTRRDTDASLIASVPLFLDFPGAM
jgi:hypothetical protein